MQGAVTSQLAGREPERARIAAFAEALADGARTLHIRGEPGIGKTALWRLAVADARAPGAACWSAGRRRRSCRSASPGWSTCSRTPGSTRTRSWARTTRSRAAGRCWRAAVARAGRAGRARRRRPAVARRSAPPGRCASPCGAWTPSPSACSPRCAATRATRWAPPASSRPGRCAALDLGPLELEALRRALGGTFGAISRPSLHRIHAISGGNPLYAIELARGPRDGGPRLPDSLQAALASRLDAVPCALAGLLEAVSALGPTAVHELRALLPVADVDALLDEAEERELLVVDEDLRVRFSHPLIGSAVYGRMRPRKRQALHARLAAAGGDPDVRARHLALSTDVPDAAVAALLDAAAERARRREAFELAADFAGHALRLTPPGDAADAQRRALAEIQDRGVAGEVRRALALADALVARTPPGPARCEALLARGSLEDDTFGTSIARLREALADAGEDASLRPRALNHLGWTLGITGLDLAAGIASVREAVALTDPVLAGRQWMTFSADLAYLEALAGRPPTERMAQAVALEPRFGTHIQFTSPRTQQAELALWSGDLATAHTLFTAVRRDAARSGTEIHHPYESFDLALVACAAGDFAAAEAHVREGVEAARDAEDSYGERLLLYPLALVHAWRGRADEARAAAARRLREAGLKDDRPGAVRARAVLGLLALAEDDCALAARELAEAARLLDAMGFAHPGAFPVLPDAVEALAGAGKLRGAQALLARLEHQAATTESPWARAAAARSRGALLLARGDAREACAPVEWALAAFERLGHRPDAARARFLLGRVLLRAGRRNAAADALAGAREAFAAMGAPAWAARAARELERAAPGRTAGTLTPAERRVAALVAEGMRNREICQALFMSVGTVEAHLTRIYRKLGIRSRSELARMVAGGGLG